MQSDLSRQDRNGPHQQGDTDGSGNSHDQQDQQPPTSVADGLREANSEHKGDGKQSGCWRCTKKGMKWVFSQGCLERAVSIAGVVGLFVLAYQTYLSREALKDSRKAAIKAESDAAESKRETATRAAKAAAEATAAADRMERAVKAFERVAEANRKTADLSKRSFETAVELERARLVAIRVVASQFNKISIIVRNDGRTFATDIDAYLAVRTTEESWAPEPLAYTRSADDDLQRNTLAPGETIEVGAAEITSMEMAALSVNTRTSRRVRMFLTGLVAYRDSLARRHKLRLCFSYRPREAGEFSPGDKWIPCAWNDRTPFSKEHPDEE